MRIDLNYTRDAQGNTFKEGDVVRVIKMYSYEQYFTIGSGYKIENWGDSFIGEICLCIRGSDNDLTNIAHAVLEKVYNEWDE